jgi:hypothetical protein
MKTAGLPGSSFRHPVSGYGNDRHRHLSNVAFVNEQGDLLQGKRSEVSMSPNGNARLLLCAGKLLRIVLRLWHRVRTIKEKSYNLLEYFFSNVHRAVDPIARLRPIHFAHSDLA